MADVYRPNVDYTLATQITSPVSGKTAFIPSWQWTTEAGVPFGTASNPVVVSTGAGGAGLTAQDLRSGTAAKTSVASSASQVTILAAALTTRKGATITNTDANTLYLDSVTGVSATDYMVAVPPGGYYEVPFGWSGALFGIWAADGAGSALVREFT